MSFSVELTKEERMSELEGHMRKLPDHVGGGVFVSPLAYDVIVDIFMGCDTSPQAAAERHGCDEADVLRVFSELTEKGVLVREGNASARVAYVSPPSFGANDPNTKHEK